MCSVFVWAHLNVFHSFYSKMFPVDVLLYTMFWTLYY